MHNRIHSSNTESILDDRALIDREMWLGLNCLISHRHLNPTSFVLSRSPCFSCLWNCGDLSMGEAKVQSLQCQEDLQRR